MDRSGSGNNVLALNKVNMQVYRGEILAITGQNGPGKSTLARHFNALLTPRSSEVIVDGLSVADKKNTAAIRRAVGMVFKILITSSSAVLLKKILPSARRI